MILPIFHSKKEILPSLAVEISAVFFYERMNLKSVHEQAAKQVVLPDLQRRISVLF